MGTFSESSFENIEHLEKILRIQKGFLFQLEDDDDWSYVIKLHALFEASIAHLILSSIGNDKLEDIIFSLPLGNKKNGKLAFANSLGVLKENELAFIQFITDIRNKLVHRIQNVSFTFDEYFKKLSDDEVQQIYWKWGLAKLENRSGEEFLKIFRVKPKMFVHLMSLLLLEMIYLKHQIKTFSARVEEILKKNPK